MSRELRRYEHVLRLANSHNSGGKFSMACSVYRGKKLLYVGFNKYPSSRAGESINRSYTGIGVHAELQAVQWITSNDVDRKRLSLYVAGTTPNGTPITSKPCPRCNNLLLENQFRSITYFNGSILVTEHINTLVPLVVPIFNERILAC